MSVKRPLEIETEEFRHEWTQRYCFTQCDDKTLCMICKQGVAVVKEYNLKLHFETNHSDFSKKYSGESRSQKIASMLQSLNGDQQLIPALFNNSNNPEAVSFEISMMIATTARSFSDGEFAKKCLMKASKKLCCKVCEEKFERINLIYKKIQERIVDVSNHIKLKTSIIFKDFVYFSLALTETTDITYTSQMAVFVRGITPDFEIHEELLKMYPLQGHTKSSDLLDNLLNCLEYNNLDLKKLRGIITDGSSSITAPENGLMALILDHIEKKGITTKIKKYHCIIHQFNLVGKKLGFDKIMKDVITTVHFIRSRGYNQKHFRSFLEEIETEYGDVVNFAEVTWLNKGRVLQRFMALIEDIKVYLIERHLPVGYFDDPKWLCDLAFLTDINFHITNFTRILQRKKNFISDMACSALAFQKKLNLFKNHILRNQTDHFPHCKTMFEKYHKDFAPYVKYIEKLQVLYEDKFGDIDNDRVVYKKFANPYNISYEKAAPALQLELIDLQSNEELKTKYKENNLLNFYKCLEKEYFPQLTDMAANCFCLFGNTHICEQIFVLLRDSKTIERKYRGLDESTEAVLRLNTTGIKPNITDLISNGQPGLLQCCDRFNI